MSNRTRTMDNGRFAARLTEEEIASALRQYIETDLSISEIALPFQVHPETIRQLINKLPGYAAARERRSNLRRQRIDWDTHNEEFLRLVAGGMTFDAIAAHMNIPFNAIRWHARQLGIKREGASIAHMNTARIALWQEKRAARVAEPKLVVVPLPPTPRPIEVRGTPGVAQPPISRTWSDLVDLAYAEGRELISKDHLIGWNRSRIAQGYAPYCIKITQDKPKVSGWLLARGVSHA